jgi:hypothetical protein
MNVLCVLHVIIKLISEWFYQTLYFPKLKLLFHFIILEIKIILYLQTMASKM